MIIEYSIIELNVRSQFRLSLIQFSNYAARPHVTDAEQYNRRHCQTMRSVCSLIATPGRRTHSSPLRVAGAMGERPMPVITVFGFSYFQSA